MFDHLSHFRLRRVRKIDAIPPGFDLRGVSLFCLRKESENGAKQSEMKD